MKLLAALPLLALALSTIGCTRTETRYIERAPTASAPARPQSYGTASVTWVNPSPAAPAAPAASAPAHHRQPAMRQAICLLQQARTMLFDATRDKGGHRLRAIRHTDVAISEAQAGIDFDRSH